MDSDAQWAEGARQFQRLFGDSWAQALKSMQPVDLGALSTATQPHAPVRFVPEKLAALQRQYIEEARALWSAGLHKPAPVADRRFASEAWVQNPLSSFSAAAYLLNARTLMGLADAVEGDEKASASTAAEDWLKDKGLI